MLPTPDTSHVRFAAVYEPAEDSFLLLDALAAPAETAWLHARFAPAPPPFASAFSTSSCNTSVPAQPDAAQLALAPPSPPPLVVEIGPGSGVVLAFLAANAPALLGRADALTLGVDANPLACSATHATLARNAPAAAQAPVLGAVAGDLTAPLRARSVDVLVCNPPYVPSEEIAPLVAAGADDVAGGDGDGEGGTSAQRRFERDMRALALATDGGRDGMEVTGRLLEQLDSALSARGVAYVLLCARNRPEDVVRGVQTWGPAWRVSTVKTSGRQGGWERLQIVRIERVVKAGGAFEAGVG